MRILFNSGIPEWAWLSNFWPCTFRDSKGQEWRSSEHYYQAQKAVKAGNLELARAIKNAPDARTAKKLSKGLPRGMDQGDWAIAVMRKAISYKFTQDWLLGAKLTATMDSELVEYAPWGDTFWGVDKSYVGQNWTGRILMDLRAKLQEEARLAVEPTPGVPTTTINIKDAPAGWEDNPRYCYIGRPKGGGGMHYGNPFTHLDLPQFRAMSSPYRSDDGFIEYHDEAGCAMVKVPTREKAVTCFEKWLLGHCWDQVHPQRRQWILDHVHELKGKTLVCFCKPQSCHGDVLAYLADQAQIKECWYCGATYNWGASGICPSCGQKSHSGD